MKGKQKLSLEEGDKGNAENIFEFHAQALTNEGLLELEKESFKEIDKQHLSASATRILTDGNATDTYL